MAHSGEWVAKPHRLSILAQVPQIWRRRKLLLALGVNRIFQVYQKAILGVLWLFIRPLVMVIGATVLVNGVLNIGTDPIPYQVYVLASFAGWILFQRGMTWCTKGLPSCTRLMRQFYFPRLILHWTNQTPSFVECGAVVICFLVALGVFWHLDGALSLSFGWHNLLLVPCLLLIICLASGLSAFTAVLNTVARDTWFTLRYVLSIWMVLTPVFYPLSALPEAYQPYALLNPVAPLILGIRWALFHTEPMPWLFFGISCGVVVLINLLGAWFFLRWESWALDRA